MRDVRILFVIAGFSQHSERLANALSKRHEIDEWLFLARDYPNEAAKRIAYPKTLINAVNQVVFGPNGATNFCRGAERPCSVDEAEGLHRNQLCDRSGQDLACSRARPRMVVALAAPWIVERLFEACPRSLLIFSDPTVDYTEAAFSAWAASKIGEINEVLRYITNASLNRSVHNLPYLNFQLPTGVPIAREVFERPAAIAEIMGRYHDALYDSGLQNPRRKLRGGYRFNDDVAFQRDRLHNEARLGALSRADVLHLFNAYHSYGIAVEPGFHFDVFERADGRVGHSFTDVLSGDQTGAEAQHVNITPCDRAWVT
ncbi:hypothetical protein MMB232_00714 [Brevundimonas subvibrioides]|uniref:hypothetical protein n=1 Tax=Brevundimonas subvibrioides TaxID=74313 RepID=UPI0032D58BF5